MGLRALVAVQLAALLVLGVVTVARDYVQWIAEDWRLPILDEDPVRLQAAIVAPWIAFNLHHYGALTGSDEVQELMEPTLNPGHVDYGVGDLAGKHAALLNGVLPDEWWVEFLSTAKRRLRDVFMGLVMAVPLVAAERIPAAERRRARAHPQLGRADGPATAAYLNRGLCQVAAVSGCGVVWFRSFRGRPGLSGCSAWWPAT